VNTFSELWRKLSNRKYRAAFARTQFKRLIPLQVQTLRRQRGWSQEVLAERAKLTQGVISRAEDQDNGNLTVNTILSIAEGLDVAFVGRFVAFSELNRWYVSLSRENMRVPSFDQENEAMIAAIAPSQQNQSVATLKVDVRYRNESPAYNPFRNVPGEIVSEQQSPFKGLNNKLLEGAWNGGSANADLSNSASQGAFVR